MGTGREGGKATDLWAANDPIDGRREWWHALTQTYLLTELEHIASRPAPGEVAVVGDLVSIHLVRLGDIGASVVLLDDVDEAVAVIIGLRREVWKGARGAADILILDEAVTKVGGRIVLGEVILRDATPLGKGPTPVSGLDLNI